MSFEVLPHHPLDAEITFHRPQTGSFKHVEMSDPALAVMTDLKQTSAVTVGEHDSIEAAEELMKRRAVRLLLVTDIHDVVRGIVTANDVSGDKPLKHIQTFGGKHSDIEVTDVMSKADNIEVLQIKDVSTARVGDIVETLRSSHRQHALVVDYQGVKNEQTIRGILSLNQIARNLGIQLRGFEIVETLAEIAQHTRR